MTGGGILIHTASIGFPMDGPYQNDASSMRFGASGSLKDLLAH